MFVFPKYTGFISSRVTKANTVKKNDEYFSKKTSYASWVVKQCRLLGIWILLWCLRFYLQRASSSVDKPSELNFVTNQLAKGPKKIIGSRETNEVTQKPFNITQETTKKTIYLVKPPYQVKKKYLLYP